MSNISLPNISSTTISPSHFNTTLQNLNSTQKPVVPVELYASTATIVAYSLVYGLVSIVALTGHLMVFIVMFMNRTMHTATNVLLLNMSLSDILFVLFSVPGLLSLEVCNGRWPYSESMAKMTQQTTILCAASSIFTMMAIAFERFLAVVYPLRQMARKKKTTIAIAMVIIWLCAIALSIPLGVYTITDSGFVPVERDGVIVSEKVTYMGSTMTKEQDKAYSMVIFMCINAIPILFLSVFYSLVIWKLWNPDQRLARGHVSTSNDKKQKSFVEKTRRKTTIMLLTVVFVFFICLFPFNIFSLLLSYRGISEFDINILRHAQSVIRVLLLVNSATNPIIYNFLSEKFRTGFLGIFTCRWRVLRRVSTTTDGETILS